MNNSIVERAKLLVKRRCVRFKHLNKEKKKTFKNGNQHRIKDQNCLLAKLIAMKVYFFYRSKINLYLYLCSYKKKKGKRKEGSQPLLSNLLINI